MQRDHFSEILEISFFYFLRLFQSFFKGIFVKARLTKVGLMGVLPENLGFRKFKGTESCPPKFRATDSSPKMLSGLILHSKRHICAIQNKQELISPLFT